MQIILCTRRKKKKNSMKLLIILSAIIITILIMAQNYELADKFNFYMKKISFRSIMIFVLGLLAITICSCKNNPSGAAVNYGRGVDQEGKPFKTVKIGSQTWMAENLNVGHFNNGDPIPEVKDNEEWVKAGLKKEPAWCYYKNITSFGKKYGRLYNGYAVSDPRGLAPKGWHIPVNEEFNILRKSVGYNSDVLKAVGQYHNVVKPFSHGDDKYHLRNAGTNKTGFTAYLAGCRGTHGFFNDLDVVTQYWSSSVSLENNKIIRLYLVDSDSVLWIRVSDNSAIINGFSVRCVKN
jgi:uncharacterized protein (TIGR02145 family)